MFLAKVFLDINCLEFDEMNNEKTFDPIKYKMTAISNWNTVAHSYHDDWASEDIGPFKSTQKIVSLASINPNDKVLDIACGTGVVSKRISKKLGKKGLLIGCDIAYYTLKIAKEEILYSNFHQVQMDSEHMSFSKIKFDKILCQFGMMFFINPFQVLVNIREYLSKRGKLIIAVHGDSDKTPYFSSIMKSIVKHIPQIRPEGTPNVHSLGKDGVLEKMLIDSNYSKIKIYKKKFVYNAGTFEQYWNDYMSTTANSIRKNIEDYGENIISKIKNDSDIETRKYIQDKNIIFPWEVIIAVSER